MKYLIVENEILRSKGVRSPRYPILFPDHISHDDAVPKGTTPISAGFFDFGRPGGQCLCSGESKSLGLKSNPIADLALIATWFAYGESVLIMAGQQHAEACL